MSPTAGRQVGHRLKEVDAVPGSLWSRRRLLAAALLCGAIGPVRAAESGKVYLLTSGNPQADGALAGALSTAGYQVTRGVATPLWDGTQARLETFDLVVVLASFNWNSGAMPASGQRDLVRFVAGGGGMLTGEWLLWNTYLSGYTRGLAPVMAATTGSYVLSGAPTTYSRVTPDPVLNAGLPDSFTFGRGNVAGAESSLLPKPGATVFYHSSEARSPGLVGWQYQSGRVLNFSTFISHVELENADYHTLLLNAARWAARRPAQT